MASFRVNSLGLPLVQDGTASDDSFRVATPGALLTPGLQQNGLGGTDTLVLGLGGSTTLTDAHFAGLLGFERLHLVGTGPISVTLGSAAEAAFGAELILRLSTSMTATTMLQVDGSAVGAGTVLRISGRDADDILTGGAGDDHLFGGTGADVISGGDGADRLSGGDGGDSLSGGAGADILAGGADGDTLLGGAGGDRLRGEEGNDRLDGGADNDVLEGGAGADVFVMGAAGGADVVRDFSIAEDQLDLSALGIRTLTQALGLARQVGSHTRFDFADGGRVTLQNVARASLDASDFVFAAGTAPTDIFFADGGTLASGGRGVGIIGATDADMGDTFTFSVDDARFEFLFGAILRLKDGEPGIEDSVEPSITLTITATDSFGLTYSELFTIDVLTPGIDTNDLSLPENRGIGTLVGEWFETGFARVDTLVWEVVTPDAPFAFQGNRLVTTGVLDFETADSHEITVRATDPGTGRVVERTVTVTVEDQTDTNLNQTLTRAFTGTDGASAGAAGESLTQSVFTSADNPAGTVLQDFVVWNGTVTGGNGADGNAGGSGGDATATISSVFARTGAPDQAGQDQVTINLLAQGGAGGDGAYLGGGGGAALSEVFNSDSAFSADIDLTLNIRALGGDGGAGGDSGANGGIGGSALARMDAFSTLGSPGVNATFDVEAIGGNGGEDPPGGSAGAGGNATAQISGINFGFFAPDTDDTLVRLEATATGGAGSTRGDATISILSNVIALGAGADILQIAAYFDGATHTLNFSGNEFYGDSGRDTLDLSGVYGGFGATIDLRTNSLILGSSPSNTILGFEEFFGTESADRFVDGADPQVYRGGSGADVFVFAPGGSHDSIGDFQQGQDLIDLEGYDFADFAALTIIYGGGDSPDDPAFAALVLDGGSSISISFAGAPVTLAASDFLL